MDTTGPSALRRAGWWVLLGALFVGFVALGSWQLQRRAWKLALIERVEQRAHAAPVPLPAPSEWPNVSAARNEYLAVNLNGRWLPAHTLLSQAVTELGGGFWVMTPLQLADGHRVWINRGFIPDAERRNWLATDVSVNGNQPVTVAGLLRMTEPDGGFLRQNDPGQARWHSRDVIAMARARQLTDVAPFFVDAGLPDSPSAASATTTSPRAGMTVISFRNTHLVYALTWFGLAALTVVAARLVWRHQRAAQPDEEDHALRAKPPHA